MKSFWMGLVGSMVGFIVMTGMSWYFQDVFTVDRNGTIDLRVTTGGNIGIGVQGASDSVDSRLVVKGSGTGTTTSALDVQASNGTSRLFVRDDGNVGIGTSTPGGRFSVWPGTSTKETLIDGWNSTDHADIDSLLPGSIFGNLVQGPTNGHFTVGMRDNDVADAFSIVSGGGNFTTDSTYDTAILYARADGNVGLGTTSPDSTLELGGASAAMSLNENSATPANPASGAECRVYMKADKLVIQYNDAGTVRYKYLDLTGTGVTWVHSTTAP